VVFHVDARLEIKGKESNFVVLMLRAKFLRRN
jgi:hypothetical protein